MNYTKNDFDDLSRWAETDDAAEAFATAPDIPDDDETFLKVQEAARRELRGLATDF